MCVKNPLVPERPDRGSEVAVVGPNVTGYSDTGLASRVTYYYRVRAYNGVGNSAYSNLVSAVTQRRVGNGRDPAWGNHPGPLYEIVQVCGPYGVKS